MPVEDSRAILLARTQAEYSPFGYAAVFVDDLKRVAEVGTAAATDSSTALGARTGADAARDAAAISAVAANASASAAAAIIPATLDRSVGRRLNDTAIWAMIRSTPSWGIGPTGNLEETPVDTLPWEFDPATLAPRGANFAGARTNITLNSRAENAVPGTPGTLPTNWFNGAGSTLTPQVVGSGTVNGYPYLDIRHAGTAAGNEFTRVEARCSSQTYAVGDVLSWGAGVALIAGSLTGFDQYNLRIYGQPGSPISKTIATPNATRALYEYRDTLASAGTGQANISWLFRYLAGTAIDATFRYYLPRTERAAFLSAPILAPVGSPGSPTRGQGSVSISIRDLGSRYNRRQGVLIIDWNSQPGAFASAADTDVMGLVSLGDLSANEVMGLLINPAHTSVEFRRTVGGVAQSTASRTITAPAVGETIRCAMAWDIDAGLMQVAARGAVGTQLTGQTALPAITHVMPGRYSTTRPLYGRIHGLEIRPAAVFGTTLAALT